MLNGSDARDRGDNCSIQCESQYFRVSSVSLKEQPNHALYIQVLRRMSSEARLMKAFELTAFSRHLFLQGLRRRFPDLTQEELHRIYLNRLAKCHNRNY